MVIIKGGKNMFGKLKLTIHNLIITILALIVVATFNTYAGATTFIEILSGECMNFHPYCDVFMFYWIYVIALAVTVVFSLINRYDFSVISAAVTLAAILIICFAVNNWDEFVYILYPVASIITLAFCMFQKNALKNQGV